MSGLTNLTHAENDQFVLHPQFEELKKALVEKDLARIRTILHDFSLLRDVLFFDAITWNDPRKYYFNDYMFTFGLNVDTPEIIYEILAAGFPVYDLLLVFKRNNKEHSIKVLLSLLPQLSEKAINMINGRVDNTFYNCVLSLEPPKIPIKIQNVTYDLNRLVDATVQNPMFNNGWSGEMALMLIDQSILDIEYIRLANNLLPQQQFDNELNLALRKIQPEDILNESLSFLNSIIASEAPLYKLQFISYVIANAIFFIVVNALLTHQVWSNQDKQSFETISQFAMASLALLLSQTYCILAETKNLLALAQGKPMPHKLLSQSLSNKLMPFVMENAYRIKERNRCHENYNYAEAQRTLPRDIVSRFSTEYTANTSPPLLFWKQAFEANNAVNNVNGPAYNNTPAFKRTICKAPVNYPS